MSETYDLIVRGGTVVTPGGAVAADLAVRDGRIARLGGGADADAAEVIDAAGLHVLPGVWSTRRTWRAARGPRRSAA